MTSCWLDDVCVTSRAFNPLLSRKLPITYHLAIGLAGIDFGLLEFFVAIEGSVMCSFTEAFNFMDLKTSKYSLFSFQLIQLQVKDAQANKVST